MKETDISSLQSRRQQTVCHLLLVELIRLVIYCQSSQSDYDAEQILLSCENPKTPTNWFLSKFEVFV